MSTIVYRDGILAADTRAYAGYNLPLGQKMKIRKLSQGGMAGVSTRQPGLGEAVLNWIDGKAEQPECPDFTALSITPEGDVFFYSGSGMPSGPLTGEFFAVGSGAEAALGAMHMGANAIQAVEVASKTDVWTGLPVMAVPLSEAQVKEQPVKKIRKRRFGRDRQ